MANKAPAEGINFPLGEKADRSTTDSQKKIFAATFSAIGEDKLAQDVLNERNWRYNYNRHVLKHVQVSLKSPENAVNAAKAGLDWIYNNFEFIRDGKTYKFHEALKSFPGSYETGVIKGSNMFVFHFFFVIYICYFSVISLYFIRYQTKAFFDAISSSLQRKATSRRRIGRSIEEVGRLWNY